MDQDTSWYGGRPRPRPQCVGWGPSSTHLKKGHNLPHFWPMFIVAKRLDGSRYHLDGGRPRPRPHCVTWRSTFPTPKTGTAPIFGPCLLWPRSPISATAELLETFLSKYVCTTINRLYEEYFMCSTANVYDRTTYLTFTICQAQVCPPIS